MVAACTWYQNGQHIFNLFGSVIIENEVNHRTWLLIGSNERNAALGKIYLENISRLIIFPKWKYTDKRKKASHRN